MFQISKIFKIFGTCLGLMFSNMSSISNESKEKLDFIKPENLGQAMRISGIKPSDISILSVYLSRV